MATYQDLLTTPADEDAFETLATSVPCRVDPATGERQELGPPGLYQSLNDSPDGTHLLVYLLQRPFSFRVPWVLFARRAEVWDAAGTPVTVVADLPVSDEVPRQGVPTGRRLVSWEERAPASLVWAEALDGGDPVTPAEHRDRIFRLGAPFTGQPRPVLETRHRCLGWYDLDAPNQLLMTEHDRDRRWLTTWLLDLAAPDESRVVFDLSMDDSYADPGSPLVTLRPDGRRTVLGDGSAIYLRGDGATPDGDRPFFDRFDLATGTATRLHESPPGCVEHVLGFTAASQPEVVIWHESPAEPPNLVAATLGGSRPRPLTAWPDPHPQLTPIAKHLVTHDRGDGVILSGMLHLPPGHDPARDGRLPLLLWAYPFDFGSADMAGQIRGSTDEFTRLTALGPVAFVLRGYAVLADATMPVIGEPETMNDTYLEQITAAARAHIRALDEAGIIDPDRVAVAGHSYGALHDRQPARAHRSVRGRRRPQRGLQPHADPVRLPDGAPQLLGGARRLRPGLTVPVRGQDQRAAAAHPRRGRCQLGYLPDPVAAAVRRHPGERRHGPPGGAPAREPRLPGAGNRSCTCSPSSSAGWNAGWAPLPRSRPAGRRRTARPPERQPPGHRHLPPAVTGISPAVTGISPAVTARPPGRSAGRP